ncbi:unnamed protein product, partial [Polarella glacialis]
AMHLIVNGRAPPGIRNLEAPDIEALDEYIQRCKLGPFRPSLAMALAQEVANAASAEERACAAQELDQLRSATRSELCKLKHIQDNRFAKMQAKALSSCPAPTKMELSSCPAPTNKQPQARGGLPKEGATLVFFHPGSIPSSVPPESYHAKMWPDSNDIQVIGMLHL